VRLDSLSQILFTRWDSPHKSQMIFKDQSGPTPAHSFSWSVCPCEQLAGLDPHSRSSGRNAGDRGSSLALPWPTVSLRNPSPALPSPTGSRVRASVYPQKPP